MSVARANFERPPHHLKTIKDNQSRWTSIAKNLIQELISETIDAQHQIYHTLIKFNEWKSDGKSQLPMEEIAIPEIGFFAIALAIHSLFKWRQDDPSDLADKLCETVLRENIEDGYLEITESEALRAFQTNFPKYRSMLFAVEETPFTIAMELSGLFVAKQNYLIGTTLVTVITIILDAMKRVIEECV